MNIGFWGAGNLTNDFIGNDGVTDIRLPLMRKLNDLGHNVFWDGMDPGNYDVEEPLASEFLPEHQSDAWFREVQRFKASEPAFLQELATMSDLDALIVEGRPAFNQDERDQQNLMIEEALYYDVEPFVWDMDMWADEATDDDLKQDVTLLRPYVAENLEFNHQEYFPYYVHDAPIPTFDSQYDLVYVGNRYDREDEMRRFLTGLEDLDILIAGNWPLRVPDMVDEFDWVNWIGPTPHHWSLPLLSLGQVSFDVGRSLYNDSLLFTMRPYEAYMAGRVCLMTTEKKDIDLHYEYRYVCDPTDVESQEKALARAANGSKTLVRHYDWFRTVEEAAVQFESLLD